jgi:hypothetical protein
VSNLLRVSSSVNLELLFEPAFPFHFPEGGLMGSSKIKYPGLTAKTASQHDMFWLWVNRVLAMDCWVDLTTFFVQ